MRNIFAQDDDQKETTDGNDDTSEETTTDNQTDDSNQNEDTTDQSSDNDQEDDSDDNSVDNEVQNDNETEGKDLEEKSTDTETETTTKDEEEDTGNTQETTDENNEEKEAVNEEESDESKDQDQKDESSTNSQEDENENQDDSEETETDETSQSENEEQAENKDEEDDNQESVSDDNEENQTTEEKSEEEDTGQNGNDNDEENQTEENEESGNQSEEQDQEDNSQTDEKDDNEQDSTEDDKQKGEVAGKEDENETGENDKQTEEDKDDKKEEKEKDKNNPDTKVIVYYRVDGGEWSLLDTINAKEYSNKKNGGYFEYEAPLIETWEDIENLEISLEGVSEDEFNFSLDSLWVDAEYQQIENEFVLMSDKDSWEANETPSFYIEKREKNNISNLVKGSLSGSESESEVDLELTISNVKGKNQKKTKKIKVRKGEKSTIQVDPKNLTPGKNKLKVTVKEDGKTYEMEEEFTWGVLGINFNKSIYSSNDNQAHIQMGVLDDQGHTICDADLEMTITSQELGIEDELSTDDGTIRYSDQCDGNTYVEVPDYYSFYQLPKIDQDAVFEVELTAHTENGTRTITDSFSAQKEVPFSIERKGPTRIFPPADYQVDLIVNANSDFQGLVKETVPLDFEINNAKKAQINENEKEKEITWDVDWKKGESYQLGYKFNAPNISPYFYFIGPLEVGDQFEESRKWQIVSDDPTYDLTTDSTTGGSVTDPGEDSYTYSDGETVTLEATPDSGYEFTGWTGDTTNIDDTSSSSTTVTMDDNYSITAEFAPTYDLTTDSTTGGSVTDPGEDSYTYSDGETVTLEATPDSGYEFTGWTGDTTNIDDTSSSSTTVTMDDNYSITAEFATTPDPPTDLTATTYDYQRIDLSWNEPTYNGDGTIIGYKIERESPVDDGWSTLVADTGSQETTYSDSNLSSETEYNYRVSAINKADTSDPSNEDSATTDREPITISGTAYSDQGTTAFGSGKTVALLINGSLADTTQTESDGSYQFNDDYFDPEDKLTVYLSSESEKATTVLKTDGSEVTDLDLYTDHLILRSKEQKLTNTDLSTATDENSDILYSLSDGELQSGQLSILISEGIFQPGDLVNAQKSLFIESGEELDMESYGLEIAGGYENAGTFSKTEGQETTFTATTSEEIYSGTSDFEDLTFDGNGSWIFQESATIDGDFTILNGEVTAPSNITVSGSWSNEGIFNHNNGQVTFNSSGSETITDGDSPFYDLLFDGTGSWLYRDGSTTAPNSTTVSSGEATFLNAKRGTETVNGGSLLVDWYLNAHLVSASVESHNIEAEADSVHVTENSSTPASTVFVYDGNQWTESTTATTTTGEDGITPLPDQDGAIRIREYEKTSSTTETYLYNLEIDQQPGFVSYDYYLDHGGNYLTSQLGDTSHDDVISTDWYRSDPSQLNGEAPYSGLNDPPEEGSWHVGMNSDFVFEIDSYFVDIGSLDDFNDWTNSGQSAITVTTSYSDGYTVRAHANNNGEMILDENNYIEKWPADNDSPTEWNGTCKDNDQCGFGYTTDDTDLTGGTADRFSGQFYAGFPGSSEENVPVADSSGPVSEGDQTTITYKVSVPSTTKPGDYETSIYYISNVNY